MSAFFLTTVIFQQIRMETDQVKMMFAMKWMKCAGRITVYTGLTGRFFVFSLRALGRASMRDAWKRSVFILNVTKQAGFRSRKLWNRQAR